MPRLTRRSFLRTAVSAAVAAGPLAPAVARAQTSIRIGTAVLGDYGLAGPIIAGIEKGFFKAQGLAVEFIPFRGGPDLSKAVLSGDVLLGISGATDVLVFRERGAPIKMIATHVHGNYFTLNVGPDVKTVADLKGKSIGVTAPGATTWVMARMLARKQGWSDKDLQIVPLGGLDAQLAALTRKETAGFVWGDAGAVLEQQKKSRLLFRFDEVTPKWISLNQYVTEDAIKKQADTIRKAQRGLFQAIKSLKANPRDSAEAIGKRMGWTADEVAFGHTRVTGALFSEDGRFELDALKAMQDVLLEEKVLAKRLPIEEHVVNDFVPVRV
ncbi:MAG: ABC transporter substrate-binding protein [Candidatus Rokubacteria bacterium]|nr:ABC transporter substrate-binding protein [Candidatus Rokubacteria bacterium]